MKLFELRDRIVALCQRHLTGEEPEVFILTSMPSLGPRSMVKVNGVAEGFDWEDNRIILNPEEQLFTRTQEDEIKRLRTELDRMAWRNSNLERITKDLHEHFKDKRTGDDLAVHLFRRLGDMVLTAPRRNPLAGWIDAKERTPDEDQVVWAITRGGGVMLAQYAYDNEGWVWTNCYSSVHLKDGQWAAWDAEFDDDYDVVLWQSLPLLPDLEHYGAKANQETQG